MSNIEFDGLVVEGPNGVRLVAIPTALLEILQYAEVIQYKKGDRVSRLRVANFTEPRSQEEATRAAAQEIIHAAANSAAVKASSTLLPQPHTPGSSAPTQQYGAPVLPISSPSPTPPPPPGEGSEDPADPANIPLRARRGGQWVTIHVTRAQYEQYQADGRISPSAPEAPAAEGDDQ